MALRIDKKITPVTAEINIYAGLNILKTFDWFLYGYYIE